MSTQAPPGQPDSGSECRASLTQAPSPPPSGSESAAGADSERRVRVLQCHHTQKFQIGGTCFQVPGEPAWVPVPPSRWLFLAGALGQAAGTPAGMPLPSESRIVGDGGELTLISVPVQCAQQKSTVSELQRLKKSADSDIYHPWRPASSLSLRPGPAPGGFKLPAWLGTKRASTTGYSRVSGFGNCISRHTNESPYVTWKSRIRGFLARPRPGRSFKLSTYHCYK